jgi:hypothetical protein
MKTKQTKWCGEGDLNPHDVTTASTSTQTNEFRGRFLL